MLRAAIANNHLEMVVVLLKLGASMPSCRLPSFGSSALTGGAYRGCRSILLLVQHSANPDLQDTIGGTALMLDSEGEATTPLQLPGERDQRALLRCRLLQVTDVRVMHAHGGCVVHAWHVHGVCTECACMHYTVCIHQRSSHAWGRTARRTSSFLGTWCDLFLFHTTE